MNLPYGASEKDLTICISIIRDITGNWDVNDLGIAILTIVEAKGGDFSEETIRAIAESYLK